MAVDESQHSSTLSDRELQIVELVTAGLTNQEIAEQLEISKRTVDNHISNILTKTATGNRVALVRWALQWGKVCLDEVNCCVLPTAAALPRTIEIQPIEPRSIELERIDAEGVEPGSVTTPAELQPFSVESSH
jgi:DNA-binding CsgD family transcriptional regulator